MAHLIIRTFLLYNLKEGERAREIAEMRKVQSDRGTTDFRRLEDRRVGKKEKERIWNMSYGLWFTSNQLLHRHTQRRAAAKSEKNSTFTLFDK